MDSNADLYEKMAEIVGSIDEIDGVRVDEANIAQRVQGNQPQNPIAAMMGMGGNPETESVIALVVEPTEGPHAPYPDDPKPEDFEDVEVEEET